MASTCAWFEFLQYNSSLYLKSPPSDNWDIKGNPPQQQSMPLLAWQIIKVLKETKKACFKLTWVSARGVMQRRGKDLGGAQDGKTKLANCVFFVVLATRRSQRRTNGYGGIWCKGQVSLPALKLPLLHSHHVRSRICQVILQLCSYQGRTPPPPLPPLISITCCWPEVKGTPIFSWRKSLIKITFRF